MRLNALCQRCEIITAFQTTHESSFAVRLRDAEDEFRQRLVILGLETQRADGVGAVGVEAGAEQHEFGLHLVGSLLQRLGEGVEVNGVRRAERERDVAR